MRCISLTACLIVNLKFIDYLTANDPSVQPALNDSQKADLYAELASGGETGWDFSMRWFTGSLSTLGGLLSLNVRNVVGPDLNAILCEYWLSKNDTRSDLYCRQEPSCVGKPLRFFQHNCSQPTHGRCCIPESWYFGSSLGFTKSLLFFN